MDSQKNQISDRLKQATNVLVTVSANPSVDQLAGAIGLTLLLNKLGKHATAVFSGQIPSTIEFLQPEKTLEKTTDSLRDFIIALDKSKADKLRYKVEDQVVKIFITPYRTSISDKDLEFSQGDFNVDVVMALGVTDQKDLDQAITSHGRILHDATVISVSAQAGEASLGSIHWVQADASSLCEMLLDVGLILKADALDSQMATAFLTGIVAETGRFSNEKTSSATMQLSAKLIAAGANQQLVATQLQPAVAKTSATPASEVGAELPVDDGEQPVAAPPVEVIDAKSASDGAFKIDHGEKKPLLDLNDLPEGEEPEENPLEQIDIDKEGTLKRPKDIEAMKQKVIEPLPDEASSKDTDGPRLITQPPTVGLGGTFTANSQPEALDPSTDPLGASAPQGPLLSHVPYSPQPVTNGQSADTYLAAEPASVTPPAPLPVPKPPSTSTLSDLEKVVDSPHLTQTVNVPEVPPQTDQTLNTARDAVTQAVSSTSPQILEPVKSLNAYPMDLSVPSMPSTSTPSLGGIANSSTMTNPSLPNSPALSGFAAAPQPDLPSNLVPPAPGLPTDSTAGSVSDPTAPPPVPPPLIPPAMPPAEPPADGKISNMPL